VDGSLREIRRRGGGHNPVGREYCKKTRKNISGFTEEETKPEEAAEAIRRKIEALEDLVWAISRPIRHSLASYDR
jgi:hypothetical protein